jgi:two-component system, response regulator
MSRSGIILLVEDNEDDVELTLRAFAKCGITNKIDVARDGAEALDYLLGSGSDARPLPQLVLLDLKLPKIEGLEVLRRLRAHPRTRALPVVVLSSSSVEQDIAETYALGANSFVRKAVNFTEFVEAARQLGLYWLDLNRTALA